MSNANNSFRLFGNQPEFLVIAMRLLSKAFVLFTCSLTNTLPAYATNPPSINPATGVYSTYQSTATISGEAGASLLYSLDGTTPSIPYTGPIALPNSMTIKAIANLSGVNSTVTTANIQSDPNSLPVPRNGLSLWLKSDFGPILSGTKVTQWSDLSGGANANDAFQSTNTKRPTLAAGAINGYPAVNFNGTSQYLNLSNGLSELTSGFACFAVMKPSNATIATLFTTGNSGPSDLVSLQTNNTQAQFNAWNSTSSSSLATGTGALSLNKFQALDVVHNGAGSASIVVNNVSVASGTVQNLLNTSRTQNYIGTDNTITNWWKGQLAELLVYSRTVATSERAAIEAYLSSRYQFSTAIATPKPVLSVATSTLTGPTQVAISALANASVYFTLDGSTPDPATSQIYQKPINIYYSQTLKAIAVANGIKSGGTTAAYNLNAAQWPAPSAIDASALQINLQLPTTAIPQ